MAEIQHISSFKELGPALAAMIEQQMLEQAIEASKTEAHAKDTEHSSDAGPSSAKGKRKATDDNGDDERKTKKVTVAFGMNGSGSCSPGDDDVGSVEHDFGQCVAHPENIRETFKNVHASAEVIEALDTLTLSIKDPGAFKFGILASRPSLGVLLYGPPGTGKTLLVRAVAKQASAKVIAVSGADIRSKYVGVGERRIKGLFAFARKNFPSIIFIDEADSLFRSRSGDNSTRGHLNDITQFLAEMEGLTSSQGDNMPMVIAATNRPFDMDEGVLRRLGRRIRIDVPDRTGRQRILDIHLAGEKLDADLDLSEVAEHTHDFTGSDLRDLVWEAAIQAVREIHWLQHPDPKPPSQEHWEAGGGAIPPSSGSASSKSGASRVLRREHFLRARQLISPAPKADLVAQIADFHKRHGSTGGSRTRGGGRDPRASVINKVNGINKHGDAITGQNSAPSSSSTRPTQL
ncbi:P-loop containing nucleoside triphosphate hydrolase protein [Lasiosphaeris hirsuta]|uniref:P-loop containing nucleoside triphosphate hydrolase protein n=1 Tax=Lasiosphaeris hirsuta TaxID=260670 RepID=A0AA40A7W6_9PEZI|nr:P-loop containing nucleoside triphosphate hydrolase protein [Lasiosphaeris hirsuta]